MNTEYKKHVASLFIDDNFVSNGSIFKHNEEVFFLTAGHCLYGENFDFIPEVSIVEVQNEVGKSFKVEKILSSIEYSLKYELALMTLEVEGMDIDEYRHLNMSSRPIDNSVDFLLRGNQKESIKKYTYRDDLKFSEIDTTNDYLFDVKINPLLLTDHVGAKGSDWMGGFSGSMLFSDNTYKSYCLGVLLEIPNNADNGQMKFASLEPLNELINDIDLIDYEQIVRQYKKKSDLTTCEIDKFNLCKGYKFNNKLHFERKIESVSKSDESLDFSLFHQNSSKSIVTEFQNQNLIFLIGNPGIGKTEELKKIAFDVLKSSNYLSRYIKINNFTFQNNIIEFLNYSNFEEYDEILFILDGLDEIPDPKDFLSKLDSFISNLYNEKRKHKFLVSCRTNIYDSKSLTPTNEHKVLALKGLDIYSAKKLFCLLIGEKYKLNDEEDKHLDNLKEFLSNPTRVKLLAQFYEENLRIETNLASIWGGYINSILVKDKVKKRQKIDMLVPRIKYNSTKLALVNELRQAMLISEDNLYQLILEGNSYEELIECSLINSNLNSNDYFFEDKEVQEYLVAKSISERTFDFIIKLLSINGTNIIRPTLLNVFSFLLNILPNESKLFKRLVIWGEEFNPTFLIYIESERVPELRVSLFQRIFKEYHIEKKLWKNSIALNEDFASFGNVEENFNFLLNIISNEKQHNVARISAINLFSHFSILQKSKTKEVLLGVLQNDSFNLYYKSKIIRLIEPYINASGIMMVIEMFKSESTKFVSTSILSLIKNQTGLDKYFNFIKREFLWTNGIVLRKDRDEVIRGNAWMLRSYLLRFEDEKNFLELAIYYIDDYRLSTEESFREKLINRFEYFYRHNNKIIKELLNKIDFSSNSRNRHNEALLELIILKLNEGLSTFKTLLNPETFSNSKWFFARISSKDSIDYLMDQKDIVNKDNTGHLQVFRNIISNYKNRELAKYFEDKLSELDIVFNDKILIGLELESQKVSKQKEVQDNFNVLFINPVLIDKVKIMIKANGLLNITKIDIRSISNDFYDRKENAFSELNVEYDVLSNISIYYENTTIEEIEALLTKEKIIHLVTLKSLLESNKGANYKFEITNQQRTNIGLWIKEVSESIDFDNIIIFDDVKSYRFKNNEGYLQYNILKVLYYFIDTKHYDSYFSDKFKLNSLNYYNLHEFDEFSESYKKFILSINNDKKISDQITRNLKSSFLSSNGEKQMVYALENNIENVYYIIRGYLKESDKLPDSDFYELYLSKTNDFSILEDISVDRTKLRAWIALEKLSELSSDHKNESVKYAKLYLDSVYNDFNNIALGILFKMNQNEALKYYTQLIGTSPLEDIQQKKIINYTVSLEVLFEQMEELFNKIYKVHNSEDEYHWEFPNNNEFFVKLLINILLNIEDKLNCRDKIKAKLDSIILNIEYRGDDYDRKLFFSNMIQEEIERNYVNIISKPLKFNEALDEVNLIFK